MSAPKDPEKKELWKQRKSTAMKNRKQKPRSSEHCMHLSESMKGKFVGSLSPRYKGIYAKTCMYCGKEYFVPHYRVEKSKYCSISCQAKDRVGNKNSFYGKKHSDDTKTQISQTKKKQYEESEKYLSDVDE